MKRSLPTAGELSRRRLKTTLDPLDILRFLRREPRLVALLGAWHHGEALIAFNPVRELQGDPFDGIDLQPLDSAAGAFGGGWIGSWGYQLGATLERLPVSPPRPLPQADFTLGYYDYVLRCINGHWWFEALVTDERAELIDTEYERLRTLLAQLVPAATPYEVGTFAMTPDPAQHKAVLGQTLDHIMAGDIFQANICLRLEAPFSGDPLDVFCQGVAALRPAYAAFVRGPDGALASMSPELFLRRTGDEVLSSPIKGTAPLEADVAELLASAKNRAENIMIVDLMRNDLGRVSVPGSVRVPAINRAERHAVWHLVSDVIGHVRPGIRDSDLLKATFPPGSVTGAPKVRAMEIINTLETTGREAYTGCIGHVSPCAGLELNVVIRTFEFSGDRVWLGVGGGIVADSTPDGEYAECLMKARPLIDAIGGRLEFTATADQEGEAPAQSVEQAEGSIDISQGIFETLMVQDGHAIDVDTHLARLDASVRAVYGSTILAGLEGAVERRANVLRLSGRHRMRVTAIPRSDGLTDVAIDTAPLTGDAAAWTLTPRILADGFGAHKWVDRRLLDPSTGSGTSKKADRDLLLCADDGAILETARANIFVVRDEGVYTPALDGRNLPGTARARVIEILLEAGIPVFQRRMTVEDLAGAAEVFVTNSLRGVVPVIGCEGVGDWPRGRTTAWLRGRLSDFWRGTPVGGELASTGRPAVDANSPLRGRGQARVLLIDNYDSFVYNLAQYFGELGASTTVIRNDSTTVDDLMESYERGEFTHLVVSPGPGTPAEAGISNEAIRRLGPLVPTLGVCLGHQCIGEVFGATIVRAREVVHGKPSLVHHDGLGVFAGVGNPLVAARYHSLVIDPQTLPDSLRATAHTAGGVIMGIRHTTYPIEGVQMHPESILTSRGHDMLQTFLAP